jgi:hypothetical protein
VTAAASKTSTVPWRTRRMLPCSAGVLPGLGPPVRYPVGL